jgi:alpha-L-rhamnosidase
LAVGKEQYLDKIKGIWIDGTVVTPLASDNLSAQRFTLESLVRGEHLIAVEVDASPLPRSMAGLEHVHGLALFARFDLKSGEARRIGSVPNCKTSLLQHSAWHTPGYDDKAWEAARPVPIEGYQSWPPLPAMNLRRQFSLDKPVLKARLYATALGAYEARINGRRVGDALLTPEVSQYAKRVLYRTYDVTAMLKTGENALGLTVGDGWYASFDGNYAWGAPPRRVLAQLELTFVDGSRQIVATGPGWRIAESPIRESIMRVGEVYDARLEQAGWDSGTFDDSQWLEAKVVDAPHCRVVAQTSPPIRAMQILKPSAISQPKPGVYVIDFGQCFAGWCRLHVKGTAGARIELKFAELLAPSGEIDQSSMGVNIHLKEPKRDIFILKGSVEETLEPHFTYRGFRYVQVTGLATAPTKESIAGVVIHSDLDITGRLRSDAPLIDQLWRNTVWTQRSNFVAIPTDCPSREQRGWMADAGIFWDAAAFNMDVNAFTSRQMDNVVDDQAADGAFPMLAPAPRDNIIFRADGSSPAWGDAAIILPWTTWQRCGDTSLIERHWDAMNRYMQFILDSNPDYVWRNRRSYDFGDHLSVGDKTFIDPTATPTTPKDLIGTAYWAYSAVLLGQMAEAIDHTADANRLHKVFDRVRKAFNDTFVKPDGTVGNASQTSYILALKFDLLPDDVRQATAERLAADVRNRGVSLTTGILGTQFSLDVLADTGFADLAYGLLLRNEYPSWGYMSRNSATTIWENWNGEAAYDDNIVRKISRNHYALGSVCGFLFRRMAGIDAATPGFETITIRPVPDARLKRGGADYDSIMGRISTDWTQSDDDRFALTVDLPANTKARIHLPARRSSRIEEGGKEISLHSDMRTVARLDNEAVIDVGSGAYRFVVHR